MEKIRMGRKFPARQTGGLCLVTVVLLLLSACGGGDGETTPGPDTGPAAFDVDVATELALLDLHAYQQLSDHLASRTFTLPPSYILQEQIYTSQRFSGEILGGGELVPIAFLATRQDRIFLVFRGTKTISEWLGNVNFPQTPYPYVADGGKAHKGFFDVYDSVHSTVVTAVKVLLASGPFTKLYITGHSLGGALAVLAAPELASQVPLEPVVYSFGSPRTGDPAFQQRFQSLIANSWRTANTNDLIPTLPPTSVPAIDAGRPVILEYLHVNSLKAITFGNPVQDPRDIANISTNHALCNYYGALCESTADPAACRARPAGANDCSL